MSITKGYLCEFGEDLDEDISLICIINDAGNMSLAFEKKADPSSIFGLNSTQINWLIFGKEAPCGTLEHLTVATQNNGDIALTLVNNDEPNIILSNTQWKKLKIKMEDIMADWYAITPYLVNRDENNVINDRNFLTHITVTLLGIELEKIIRSKCYKCRNKMCSDDSKLVHNEPNVAQCNNSDQNKPSSIRMPFDATTCSKVLQLESDTLNEYDDSNPRVEDKTVHSAQCFENDTERKIEELKQIIKTCDIPLRVKSVMRCSKMGQPNLISLYECIEAIYSKESVLESIAKRTLCYPVSCTILFHSYMYMYKFLFERRDKK